MSTYEYMTVDLKHMPGLTPPITVEATLNHYAAEGWRLVQILEKHHYPPLGILERPLPGGIARAAGGAS